MFEGFHRAGDVDGEVERGGAGQDAWPDPEHTADKPERSDHRKFPGPGDQGAKGSSSPIWASIPIIFRSRPDVESMKKSFA